MLLLIQNLSVVLLGAVLTLTAFLLIREGYLKPLEQAGLMKTVSFLQVINRLTL